MWTLIELKLSSPCCPIYLGHFLKKKKKKTWLSNLAVLCFHNNIIVNCGFGWVWNGIRFWVVLLKLNTCLYIKWNNWRGRFYCYPQEKSIFADFWKLSSPFPMYMPILFINSLWSLPTNCKEEMFKNQYYMTSNGHFIVIQINFKAHLIFSLHLSFYEINFINSLNKNLISRYIQDIHPRNSDTPN